MSETGGKADIISYAAHRYTQKKKKKVSVLSYIYIIFCSNSVLDARTGGLIRGVQHGYGKVDVPSRQHFHSA